MSTRSITSDPYCLDDVRLEEALTARAAIKSLVRVPCYPAPLSQNLPALATLLHGATETDGRRASNQAIPRRLATTASLSPFRGLLRVLHGRLSAILRLSAVLGATRGVVARGRTVLLVVTGVGWWGGVVALGRVAVGLGQGDVSIDLPPSGLAIANLRKVMIASISAGGAARPGDKTYGLGTLRVAALLGRRVVAATAALVVVLRRHYGLCGLTKYERYEDGKM